MYLFTLNNQYFSWVQTEVSASATASKIVWFFLRWKSTEADFHAIDQEILNWVFGVVPSHSPCEIDEIFILGSKQEHVTSTLLWTIIVQLYPYILYVITDSLTDCIMFRYFSMSDPIESPSLEWKVLISN